MLKDASFRERSTIKYAHDSCTNIEVGFLSQRLATFTGIAILTTNARQNIDDEFMR
jgi:hypothetical protein